jgi:hypothetical protein
LHSYTDQDLQHFVARALLAVMAGKVTEAERPTLRDSRQFPYHEAAHPDLVLIETRFGHNFNLSQRYVLYGEGRQKALWRLSMETWWAEKSLIKYGPNPTDALLFLDEARAQSYQLNRVIGLKSFEKEVLKKPLTRMIFSDNGDDTQFTRFVGDVTIKLKIAGFKDQEVCEAFYQGGRL